MTPLPRDFYMCGAVQLARALIGKVLYSRTPQGEAAGIIVETEAYTGRSDPAAHSFRGRPDGRTAVQYGVGGFAYVYLIYGMHCCMNVVAGPAGDPQAVLIRALQPLCGIPIMAARRMKGPVPEKLSPTQLRSLTNGPGKLASALAITRAQNGIDLLADRLFITARESAPFQISASPRINVDYAGDAAAWPYRFCMQGNPFVSKPWP